MRKFRLAFDYFNITLERAWEIVDEMNMGREISAEGFWHILPNEDATFAVAEGKFVQVDRLPKNRRLVANYSGKLVTPLMEAKAADISDVVYVMNRLYEAGAIMMTKECVKIHFLNSYSAPIAAGIIDKLVQNNLLLLTTMFFPRPLALFWGQMDKDELLEVLRYDMDVDYTSIIASISRNERGLKTLSDCIAQALRGHTRPNKSVPAKERFDMDSSPDSAEE